MSEYKEYHKIITAPYSNHIKNYPQVRLAIVNMTTSVVDKSYTSFGLDIRRKIWNTVEFVRNHTGFNEYSEEVKALFQIVPLSSNQRRKVNEWLAAGAPFSIDRYATQVDYNKGYSDVTSTATNDQYSNYYCD